MKPTYDRSLQNRSGRSGTAITKLSLISRIHVSDIPFCKTIKTTNSFETVSKSSNAGNVLKS